MEAKNSAAFVNMLDVLSRIIQMSTSVNRALGKVDPSLGYSPFVRALIGRLEHPNALVRRHLLTSLKSIYTCHQEPKQLVRLHRLAPLLADLEANDKAVLVRKVASELLESFKAHDLL